MSTVQVIVDLSNFRLEKGVVTGQIWLTVDGQAFPEPGWNDFAVVVLGWWTEAIADLLDGAPYRELLFMDGPYLAAISGSRLGEGRIRLLGDEDPKPPATHIIDLSQLAEQANRAGQEVLQFCLAQGHDDPDVGTLSATLERLRITRSRTPPRSA